MLSTSIFAGEINDMATIRKRTWDSGGETKTAWVADYFDQNRKRHLKTFKTRKAADDWLVKTRHEVDQGKHTPEHSSITVAEAAEIWLRDCQLNKREATTIRAYRSHIDLHINPLLGREKLSRLSTAHVAMFWDALREKQLSRSMQKKVLFSLKALLKEAQNRGRVGKNVAQEYNTKKDHERDKPKLQIGRDIPTGDEVRRIIDAAKPAYRPLFMTAAFTGMRASELRGLTWEHVDFDKRLIHVRQRADRFNEIGWPKSREGHRTIPMAPPVFNTLREWKLGCPNGKLKLVFPTANGNIQFLSNIWSDGLLPAQRKAGVVDADGKPKYGMHSLRHFFASWAIDQGFQAERVQQMLGHANIKMTMGTYVHLFPRGEDDAAKFAAGALAIFGAHA